MPVIKFKDLQKIRNRHSHQKIVFCHGTFDLTHVGHVLFLENCKKLGDVLVVAVAGDEVTKVGKGKNRPILNQHIRLKMVDSLKPVDYCFLDIAETPRHSLQVLADILKKLLPDLYLINEDSKDIPIRKKVAKKYGIKMRVLKRRSREEFDNISTTKIIDKVKRLT